MGQTLRLIHFPLTFENFVLRFLDIGDLLDNAHTLLCYTPGIKCCLAPAVEVAYSPIRETGTINQIKRHILLQVAGICFFHRCTVFRVYKRVEKFLKRSRCSYLPKSDSLQSATVKGIPVFRDLIPPPTHAGNVLGLAQLLLPLSQGIHCLTLFSNIHNGADHPPVAA